MNYPTIIERLEKKCGIWGKTHYGEKRIWSSRGRGDGVQVGGVGKLLRNFWEISWKSPGGPIIKSGVVKKEIKIFTIGLQGNYPTIMLDPPVEYLKMCNFPQIPSFFLKTFIYIYTDCKLLYSCTVWCMYSNTYTLTTIRIALIVISSQCIRIHVGISQAVIVTIRF